MHNELQKIATPNIKDPRLEMVRRVTKLMDEQFSIGGFKFGLDPILNLIPVVGDMGSYIISISLIITMIRHGASPKLAAKMVINATLDAFIGAVPVLGWIFDFAYKANTRNVKLLNEHYTQGKHYGSAAPVIISVLVVMLLLLALLVFLVVKLIDWILTPMLG